MNEILDIVVMFFINSLETHFHLNSSILLFLSKFHLETTALDVCDLIKLKYL